MDRNVKYTGDESCITCHSAKSETYHQSEMGRSLEILSRKNEIEDFTNNNFVYDKKSDFYYRVFKDSNQYYVTEFRKEKDGSVTHELTKKIDYVIGSGNSARSYLYQNNGFFYEMPVTWYSSKSKWDLSPGYEKNNLRFSRQVVEECMNCHNSYSDFVKYSENKFKLPIPLGIGCERCHGPGELHVDKFKNKKNIPGDHTSGSIDRTIVNPAHLTPALQNSICFQCHLQGSLRIFKNNIEQSDFRPGMQIDDIRDVFIAVDSNTNEFKIASHGERMMMSRCFKESNGSLTCNTCHNPHLSIRDITLDYVNNKCISCHELSEIKNEKLKIEHSEKGNCVSCHMKKGGTKDVPHVNFTDHWIQKTFPVSVEDTADTESFSKAVTLQIFSGKIDSLSELNLGIAYVNYYETKHPHYEYLVRAINLIKPFINNHPERTDALYYLGIAYLKQNKLNEALDIFQKLSETDKNNPNVFYQLGNVYEKLKNNAKAIEAYQTAIKIFPDNYKVYMSIGNLLYSMKKTNEAIEAYKKVLQLNNNNSGALNNLGDISLYTLHDTESGIKYFQKSIEIDPDLITAMNNLGNAYLLSGKETEAENTFKKVIGKKPEDVQAYGNLAVIYENRGNKKEALKYLDKVLEINPNDPRAKEMKKKLEK